MSKKIFYLEDHAFYANVIIPKLRKQGYEVVHCLNYKSAEEAVANGEKFDFALLDVVLTNGKTGIHFAEKHGDKFGKMLFITGCRDIQTLETLLNKDWNSVSKQYEIWDDLKDFLTSDKTMHIPLDEAC
jgi:response regulator RpfG family c-di-GMP phosphodiesterase